MKTPSKRLRLTRETVVHLASTHLANVIGGSIQSLNYLCVQTQPPPAKTDTCNTCAQPSYTSHDPPITTVPHR